MEHRTEYQLNSSVIAFRLFPTSPSLREHRGTVIDDNYISKESQFLRVPPRVFVQPPDLYPDHGRSPSRSAVQPPHSEDNVMGAIQFDGRFSQFIHAAFDSTAPQLWPSPIPSLRSTIYLHNIHAYPQPTQTHTHIHTLKRHTLYIDAQAYEAPRGAEDTGSRPSRLRSVKQ